MAYQLIWTAEADSDFHAIMRYLRENWSVYSAQKFAERTIKKLDKIAAMPYLNNKPSHFFFFNHASVLRKKGALLSISNSLSIVIK